jgi:2-methylcitrate dehydratase PrpD
MGMPQSHIEKFAAFSAESSYEDLPTNVADDSKRILLDTIGCGLAAKEIPSGTMGVNYGRILGGSSDDATIVGHSNRSSIHGAAFANAELMSALDFHTISLPGHVSPYVIPVVLGLGESLHRSGKNLMDAIAVCHEISYRMARTMDLTRDVTDGKSDPASVLGYSSTIFGVTAAATILKEMSVDATANALGIAASSTQINGHRTWLTHAPTTTIKYNLMPGSQALRALTAAYMAELGHRGDLLMLDDVEFGYPRFIGTRRWEPSQLTTELGETWGFPSAVSFKPYPHCRVTHAVFDALIEVVRTNDIKPDEIDSITSYGEAWTSRFPTFMNRNIERPYDAQFSFPHGIAIAAHLVPPGKDWQNPDNVYNPSVMDLMSRVEWKGHPDWAAAVSKDPAARPARVEVNARGTTFVGERNYAKGSPSPEPASYFTNDDVAEKFLHNAEGLMSIDDAEWVVDQVMHLENVDDISDVLNRLRPSDGESAKITT